MKRRSVFALLSVALAVAIGLFAGDSVAMPVAGAALDRTAAEASRALIKVQTACGWTYACTNLGGGANGPANVQIYGPVAIFPNAGPEEKPEPWKVPEGAWAWTGNEDLKGWRGGWSCGGHPCTENCGVFCWFKRIRNGYCGHGCDAYHEHVMFQPIRGNLKPFVYRSDWGAPYGPPSGAGYGAGYGYGQAPRGGGQYWGNQGRYGRQATIEGGTFQGYVRSRVYTGNGSRNRAETPPPANGERFMDRVRRLVYGPSRRAGYPAQDQGSVHFERPNKEFAPLRRFNGPQYPPASN